VHINPLIDGDNRLVGVSVVFFDVTSNRALLDKVVQTNHQLEAAYEELQSTNEELETTNEELQSTVEELETTNEELQSTNEELETMNEELQSTNDELHTINDALRERSLEVDQAKEFLNSLANSVNLGMVVVNREMQVVVWNQAAEELWGLRSEETIGSVLTSLDMGLPLDDIKPMIGHALVDSNSVGESVLDAVNRRGRQTRIRVTCTPFVSSESIGGAMLLMEVQA
jgi:two-component system CheB/CheR fusion protein